MGILFFLYKLGHSRGIIIELYIIGDAPYTSHINNVNFIYFNISGSSFERQIMKVDNFLYKVCHFKHTLSNLDFDLDYL